METPLKHTEFWIEITFVFIIFAVTLSVTSNNLLVETVTGFICLFLILYQHFTVHCILLSFCLTKEKQRPCKSLGSEGAPWKWTVLCAWKQQCCVLLVRSCGPMATLGLIQERGTLGGKAPCFPNTLLWMCVRAAFTIMVYDILPGFFFHQERWGPCVHYWVSYCKPRVVLSPGL